jgi:thiol-disulfide isomerase/thioredoxin
MHEVSSDHVEGTHFGSLRFPTMVTDVRTTREWQQQRPGFRAMPKSRHHSRRGAALVGAAAIALAACGGDDDSSQNGAPPTDQPAAYASGSTPPGGQTAESAELAAALTEVFTGSTTLAGDEAFDGAQLADGDSVVWFWAPWCTICRAEAPEVAEVAEQFADDVTLIGVPGRGDLDEMRKFVEDTGTGSLTHVADLGGDIWSAFGAYGQPAFAFIDDDGTVEVFIGGMGGKALAERITELIST